MAQLFLGPKSPSPSFLARASSSSRQPRLPDGGGFTCGHQASRAGVVHPIQPLQAQGRPEPREAGEQSLRAGPSGYPVMRLTLRHPSLREKGHPFQPEHSSLQLHGSTSHVAACLSHRLPHHLVDQRSPTPTQPILP